MTVSFWFMWSSDHLGKKPTITKCCWLYVYTIITLSHFCCAPHTSWKDKKNVWWNGLLMVLKSIWQFLCTKFFLPLPTIAGENTYRLNNFLENFSPIYFKLYNNFLHFNFWAVIIRRKIKFNSSILSDFANCYSNVFFLLLSISVQELCQTPTPPWRLTF